MRVGETMRFAAWMAAAVGLAWSGLAAAAEVKVSRYGMTHDG